MLCDMKCSSVSAVHDKNVAQQIIFYRTMLTLRETVTRAFALTYTKNPEIRAIKAPRPWLRPHVVDLGLDFLTRESVLGSLENIVLYTQQSAVAHRSLFP